MLEGAPCHRQLLPWDPSLLQVFTWKYVLSVVPNVNVQVDTARGLTTPSNAGYLHIETFIRAALCRAVLMGVSYFCSPLSLCW